MRYQVKLRLYRNMERLLATASALALAATIASLARPTRAPVGGRKRVSSDGESESEIEYDRDAVSPRTRSVLAGLEHDRASKRYAKSVARNEPPAKQAKLSRRADEAHRDKIDAEAAVSALAAAAVVDADHDLDSSEMGRRADDLRRRRAHDAPELQDVGDEGDCFFEALYHSARHAGILDELCKCLPIRESHHCCDRDISLGREVSQEDFIQCIRQSLAGAIAAFPNYRSHYRYIRSLEQADRREVLKNQPRWLRRIWNTHGQTYEDFIRECAGERGIACNGNWAGQLDVEVLQRMLRNCGISMPTPISVATVEEAEAYVLNDFDGHALQLVCIGDLHYNWVSGMRPL